MNDISSELGSLKRQVRDVQSVAGNVQHMLRQLTGGRASIDRPGGLVARAAVCAALGHTQNRNADDIARQHFATDRDLDRLLTLKAAVNPANSTIATWAAELIQMVTTDISDRLIPQSTFARLRELGTAHTLGKGLIKVPTWSPVATGGFVAEGSAIPVSSFTFGAITLKPKKAANIVAVTDELLFGSPVDVETTLRAVLSESLSLMLDGILLDSGAATAIRPAGLLNGIGAITASAATPPASAMAADLKALIAAISPALRPVIITGPTTAASLGLLAPNAALTVLIAPTMAAGSVIMVDAASFVSAIGTPTFRASQNVTLHEESANPLPLGSGVQGSGTLAVPMRSTFQSDTTALRTILPVDWTLRRANSTAYLTGATW